MLLYKTKNGASPQGKNKVYFCCHPQDFNTYFESVSDELLAIVSCSVWYNDNETVQRDEEFYHDLSQMNLVVVPITSRLLNTDNPAINEEIPFVLEQRIPVLPLIQEKGLEMDFSKSFKELQFLDKFSQDDTAISYKEKLKKYITSILIGDEKTQKIRDAFCTQLFLSYRKKDRRHAHELMERIHANDFFRDVAIWYDEFLVPGEDFNISIETALKKSSAFVMSVTPNLVNEANYIQEIEYPCAKQANKPIVPVEMVATDKKLLATKYPGLPFCAAANNPQELSDALYNALSPCISLSKPYDAEREYLIGMAYLNGIDVEVNRNRALEMIVSAAARGHKDAMAQLAYMYRYGDGVKRDISITLHWQEKLVGCLQSTYSEHGGAENAEHFVSACFDLAALYQQTLRYDDAKHCLRRLEKELSFINENQQKTFFIRMKCLVYSVLAEIAHSQGEFETEEALTDKAIQISEYLNDVWNSDFLRRDLSVLYRNKAAFYKVNNDIKNAIIYSEKALCVLKSFAETSDDPQLRFDLAYTYNRMAELYRIDGDFHTAKTCSLHAVEKLERLIKDEEKSVYLEYKGLFYLDLSESYRLSGDYEKAVAVLDETEKILAQLEEVFDHYQWYTKYYTLFRRAQLCLLEGKFDKIIALATMALQIQEEHHAITHEEQVTGDSSLPFLHYLLSNAYYSMGETQLAYQYAKQSADLADEAYGHNVSIVDVECIIPYSHYASLLIADQQLTEAKVFLDKAIKIATENQIKEKGLVGTAIFSSVWFTYGRLYIMEECPEEAFRYFQKAERGYTAFLGEASAITTHIDLIAIYYNMGYCQIDINPALSESYFEKTVTLIERTPVEKRQLSMWEMLGFSYYCLYSLSGVFKRGKWKKKLLGFLDNMYNMYPERFPQTQIYRVFVECGIVEC